jgi:hypothetical protein
MFTVFDVIYILNEPPLGNHYFLAAQGTELNFQGPPANSSRGNQQGDDRAFVLEFDFSGRAR